MRILFLTHSFNCLAQRLFVELARRGHEVSIEFDVNDEVSIDAVGLCRPDVIIAPFLKRAIPEAVWKRHLCLVIHPGIKGDRGPSALDWAILQGRREWGVTVLQANAEMDAGDIWASVGFPMREASKSSLYRNEVTEAAVSAVLQSIDALGDPGFRPEPLDYSNSGVCGVARPLMRQADRAIDWSRDDTETVLRKIRSADGFPGVLSSVCDMPVHLFDAHREHVLRGGRPGTLTAKRDGAILRATVDGAVWITHLKRQDEAEPQLKLPAAQVLGDRLQGVPDAPPVSDDDAGAARWREIRYEESNGVGYLHFPFYNGAMGTRQCVRLREAFVRARSRPTRVIVLMGGSDFWSNGIHLNLIESAIDPADESWRNINAIDDLAREIIVTPGHITVAALQGNAGAGGVFLAMAADRIWARSGVVLNPHYKSMGNLYGSEYWTYLLPRRAGSRQAREITENRLPLGTPEARRFGLIDAHFGSSRSEFAMEVKARAEALAAEDRYASLLAEKNARRAADEAHKSLEQYRMEELARMRLNFYGFDPSYHVARYNFVFRVPHSRTPLHLAAHRRGLNCR